MEKAFKRKNWKRSLERMAVPWILEMSLLAVVLYSGMTETNTINKNYSLKCDITGWGDNISLTKEGDTIAQEFYTAKPFDTIEIRSMRNKAEKETDGMYIAKLTDEQGKVIYSQNLSAENDGEDYVILKMNLVKPIEREKYTLTITKQKTGENAVSFRFMKGRALDSYEGSCMVNGQARVDDLSMNVYREKEMKYCSRFTAGMIASGSFFAAVLLYIGLWKIGKKNSEIGI